jgi:hypothetical protein
VDRRDAGLRGVKLVVSDSHEDIKATSEDPQRHLAALPPVRSKRNVLAYAGKSGRRVVPAFIAAAFAQDDGDVARGARREAR